MVQMQKQQAERMEGLQVGTFEMSFVYSMILNILSSTKFGLLIYTFLTHFHGWNLKIIEYNMNLPDLIINRQVLFNMMMNVPYTTEWRICLFIRIFISQWVIKM